MACPISSQRTQSQIGNNHCQQQRCAQRSPEAIARLRNSAATRLSSGRRRLPPTVNTGACCCGTPKAQRDLVVLLPARTASRPASSIDSSFPSGEIGRAASVPSPAGRNRGCQDPAVFTVDDDLDHSAGAGHDVLKHFANGPVLLHDARPNLLSFGKVSRPRGPHFALLGNSGNQKALDLLALLAPAPRRPGISGRSVPSSARPTRQRPRLPPRRGSKDANEFSVTCCVPLLRGHSEDLQTAFHLPQVAPAVSASPAPYSFSLLWRVLRLMPRISAALSCYSSYVPE